jgi:hypothetical protein
MHERVYQSRSFTGHSHFVCRVRGCRKHADHMVEASPKSAMVVEGSVTFGKHDPNDSGTNNFTGKRVFVCNEHLPEVGRLIAEINQEGA